MMITSLAPELTARAVNLGTKKVAIVERASDKEAVWDWVDAQEEVPTVMEIKTYLDEQGMKYQDLDVTEDAAAKDEMIQKSGQMGVPVIAVNGELIIGFNKERLENLLKASDPG